MTTRIPDDINTKDEIKANYPRSATLGRPLSANINEEITTDMNLGVVPVPKGERLAMAEPEGIPAVPAEPEGIPATLPKGSEAEGIPAELGSAPADPNARPVAPGPWDDAQLQTIFDAASRQSGPDYDAALAISQATNLPIDTVRAKLPEFQAQMRAAKFNPRAFREKYPTTASMILGTPQVAPLVLGDPSIQKLELAVAKRPQEDDQSILGMAGLALDIGQNTTAREGLAKKIWEEKRAPTPEESAQLDEFDQIEQALKGRYGEQGLAAEAFTAFLEQTPRYLNDAGKIVEAGGVGAAAGSVIPGLGTAAGFGYGMLAGTAVVAGEAEGALAYVDMVRKGVAPDIAYTGGMIVAALNGTLEALPMDKVLRFVPGAKYLAGRPFADWLKRAISSNTFGGVLARATGRLAEGAVFEGVTEALQEIAPTYIGHVASGAETPLADTLTGDLWRQMKDAGRLGALAGGAGHVLSPGTHIEILKEAADAVTGGDRLTEVGKALNGSKTFLDNPDLAASLFQKIAESKGMPSTIAVPAKALRTEIEKAGIDVESEMPEVARQLADAATDESEVVIATQDVAVKLGASGGFERLAPDMRVGDKPTAREAPSVKKHAKDLEKKAKEWDKERKKTDDKGVPDPKSERYLFEGVRARLAEVYPDRPSVAHTQEAALFTAFIMARAERRGMEPAEYLRSKGGLAIFQAGEYGDLTKKEQEKALAQRPALSPEGEQALATGQPGDYVLHRPGEAPKVVQPMTPEQEAAHREQEAAHRAESAKASEAAKAAQINPADFTVHRPEATPAGDLAPNAGEVLPKVDSGIAPDATVQPGNAPDMKALSDKAEIEGRASPIPSQTTRELYPLLFLSDEEYAKRKAEFLASVGQGEGSHNYVIWDEEAIKVLQTMEQRAGQTVRGFFQTDSLRSFFKITLGGNANLTTFAHETGHAMLAMLESDAMQGDLQAAEDIQTVRDWVGLKGKQKWTRESLEKFARGFEAYLWEGKAPSVKLKSVFDHFKSWMKWAYSALTRLNVDLSPEVRGVMDRLLATDMEIKEAQEKAGVTPLEASDGMDPKAYAEYRASFEAAVQEATNKAEQETLRQSRWAMTDEYARFEKQAGEEADRTQVFKAREALDKPVPPWGRPDENGDPLNAFDQPDKMDREEVRQALGKAATPDAMRRLAPYLSKKGKTGAPLDLVAVSVGYPTGEAMVRELALTPSRDAWIQAKADARMQEEYPGYNHSKIWAQENAQRALHADEVGNAIWAGFVSLTKLPKGAMKTALMSIKEAAKKRAGSMRVMELTEGSRHLRDEQRAALEAAEAWKKRDVRAAYDATRRQLLAHYTWREVTEAARRVEDIRRFLKPFQNDKKLRGRIFKGEPEALTAIDGLLNQIGFEQANKGDIAAAMAAVSAMKAKGMDVTLTPEQMKLIKNYKAMTLEDLETVYDSVRNIAHVAQKLRKEETEKGKVEWAEKITSLVNTINENRPALPESKDINTYGAWGATKKLGRSADARLRKIEFIIRMLDGGETAGKVHSEVFEPIAQAEAEEHQMYKQLRDVLTGLYGDASFKERFQHDRKVDFLGKNIKLRDVLTIALNLRNPENMKRALGTYGWELSAVLDRLDELLSDHDIELINRFGALVESYWPDIEAVHTRVHGVPPKKVTGAPVKLPSGRIIEGGYYPIIKDNEKSTMQESIRASNEDLWTGDAVATPAVAHGFTQERVDNATTPIKFSLDALPHHLIRVIHYVTHYEATRRVDRIITNDAFKNAVESRLGKEMYAELRPWLQAVVEDRETSVDDLGGIEKALRKLRMGSSVVLLAAKTTVAITQSLGLTMTMKELARRPDGATYPMSWTGSKFMMMGIKAFLGTLRQGPFKAIYTQDPTFVLHRENYDRDLRLAYHQLTSAFSEIAGAREKLALGSMYLFNLVQGTVNAVTWHAAKAKAEAIGHENPLAYASSTVRLSQSSGGPKDLSRFQRGSEWKKMWTVMFSFRNLQYNQLMEKEPANLSTPAQLASKIAEGWYMVLLPAVLTTLARADWDSDDPEDIAARLALEAKSYTIDTVPVVAELSSPLLEGRDVRGAPWIKFMANALKSTGDIAIRDGEFSQEDLDNFFNLLGTAAMLPTGAAVNAMHFIDQMDDMEEPIPNFLLRNKKDWR